jgi:hypothetical protein
LSTNQRRYKSKKTAAYKLDRNCETLCEDALELL